MTRGDLDTLYKRENFTPEKVVRSASPKPGGQIKWDQYGVPYVNGATYNDTMYGAGFAGTTDRMFLMDVLRNAGRGKLAGFAGFAGFAGATPANLAMDQDQMCTAYYTETEAQAQMSKM